MECQRCLVSKRDERRGLNYVATFMLLVVSGGAFKIFHVEIYCSSCPSYLSFQIICFQWSKFIHEDLYSLEGQEESFVVF